MLMVYKMELYKMMKRKNSLLLLIPCILSLLITLGYRSGNVELAMTGVDESIFSCLDYLNMLWQLLSAFGITGIVLLLVSASQFAGEIEHGQIKTSLLRVQKREYIIAGKVLAIFTFLIAFIAIFFGTALIAYYVLLGKSEVSSGTFALSVFKDLGLANLLLSLAGSLVVYMFAILLTYCLGNRLSVMPSFLIALIIMYAGRYLVGLESMKFMRLTPFYLETLSLAETGSGWMIGCITGTIVLLSGLFIVCIQLFRCTDIK